MNQHKAHCKDLTYEPCIDNTSISSFNTAVPVGEPIIVKINSIDVDWKAVYELFGIKWYHKLWWWILEKLGVL